MSRRQVPPDRVAALAAECARLLKWLRSQHGEFSEEFSTVLAAYNGLCEAVSYLPHGSSELTRKRALMPVRRPAKRPPTVDRDPDEITADEMALLSEPVLTPKGWLVRDDFALVKRVVAVREELAADGKPARDVHALQEIIRRAAAAIGRRPWPWIRSDLPKLKTRLSRERKDFAAAEVIRQQRKAMRTVTKPK